MIWKPKEKEYTLEEATQLAKKEFAPYWFGTSPQIVGVNTDGIVSIFPLDPEFAKKSWLIAYVDFTDFTGAATLRYAKEWYKRYHMHHLGFLMILMPTYSFLKDSDPIWEMIEHQQLKFPLCIDVDSTLAAALDTERPPKITLIDKEKRYFDFTGAEWLKMIEANIQTFLRSKDPGLPLLPFFDPLEMIVLDSGRIELGFQPKWESQGYPTALDEFKKIEGAEIREATFFGVRPKILESAEIFLTGKWNQDYERILSQDPAAALGVQSMGSEVTLIAQSMASDSDSIIAVEIDGQSVEEIYIGKDMILNESGQSILKIRKPGKYHVLSQLPKEKREINFRILNAAHVTVAIYGLRFGLPFEI